MINILKGANSFVFSAHKGKTCFISTEWSWLHFYHISLFSFSFFFVPLKLLFLEYFIIHIYKSMYPYAYLNILNIYVCAYMKYTSGYIHVYYIYVYIHVYIYIYTCVDICVCVYTHIYILYIYTHTYSYVWRFLCVYLLRTNAQYNLGFFTHTQF